MFPNSCLHINILQAMWTITFWERVQLGDRDSPLDERQNGDKHEGQPKSNQTS